jgi:hypothetical protein
MRATNSYRTWCFIASDSCLAESVHLFPMDLDSRPFPAPNGVA